MRTHPSSTVGRAAARFGVLGLLTALLLGVFALAGPSAQAAWTAGAQVHGGKVQVCKVALGDGRLRIKVRLDNRNAKHTHLGGVSRLRDGKVVENRSVRAAAGKVSDTKSLVWTRAQRQQDPFLSVGIGETNGQGLGGGLPLGAIRVC